MTLTLQRAFAVWQRHFQVWRKLAFTQIVGNIIEPMLYLAGLGLGLGKLLPQIQGVPYVQFLAAGIVCQSAMNTATFEALYSAFSRMKIQRTWEAILNTPVGLDELLLGEWLWIASKSLLSALAILGVMLGFGLLHGWHALLAIPVALLVGITFGSLGLAVTTFSPSYDFFMYYFTLIIGPMLFISGVLFPISQLPAWLQTLSLILPLRHGVELIRPLLSGEWPNQVLLHLAVLLAYAGLGFQLARIQSRKRLLR